ncbi:hypothetical protein [Altericista sp. CCNU0014]|uniref:hypothetical protein n=1 Tax=Altericista sp. CCNU0014 TaxID=3082949 RepID=UPI00384B2A1B
MDVIRLFRVRLITGALKCMQSGIFDSLNSLEGWVPDQEGNISGEYNKSDSLLTLSINPSSSLGVYKVSKKYSAKFGYGKWFHIAARARDPRLGGNLYIHFMIDRNTDSGKMLRLFSFHQNGATAWSNNCQIKGNMDEFSFSVGDLTVYPQGSQQRKWAMDFRSAFPPVIRPSLGQLVVYSFKYEEPSQGQDLPKIRIFINGYEISYENLDDSSPRPHIDMRTYHQISPNIDHEVEISLHAMTDGDAYKYPNNYRDLGCFASETPAIPSREDGYPHGHRNGIPIPSTFDFDFIMIGNGRDGDFDLNSVRQLIYAGRVGASSAIFLEMLSWQDAQFACPYMSEVEKEEVRHHPLGSLQFCH